MTLENKIYQAMASNQPLANNSIIVIGPHYSTPHQVDLYVARKVLNVTEGNNLGVFEINGNNIFKVKSAGKRRILVDAAGVPIVSLEEKKFSAHDRWRVYRGDSSDSKDLLFGVKRSKFIQLRTELDVFLASNTAEDVCDFKIKQNYRRKSVVIYQGDSQNIIAEMHKKQTVQGKVLGKDTFSINICPSIDYVFVIALRVVLDEINMAGDGGGGGGGDDGGGGGC
ncbi:hypothetical protein C5167_047082 [Papaver somniferum]|uniref:Uncharacterized protein n=1 Tax=Papaver somniferum TaxID=3469 RepID=A0A4Y7LGE0_PAPSO|nr:protein LURP-one-related 10-like [Papaver somniferum]RZC84296.1 hypothetical protein C5167_047082 [Papaver somniferum]